MKDVPSEFDQGVGRRARRSTCPFPQAIPNKPVIDAAHCRSIAYREAQARQAAEQGLSPEEAAKLRPVGPDGKKLPPCGICEKLCTTKAIRFDDQDALVTERFGAIVVANGYDLFMLDGSHDEHLAPEARKPYYGEYGYGRYPDVITALQLERLMNASGPTQGEIVRPSDGKHPRAVVFVACVGSRDEKVGRPYCSKICCMYTAKQAIMLQEHDPGSQTLRLLHGPPRRRPLVRRVHPPGPGGLRRAVPPRPREPRLPRAASATWCRATTPSSAGPWRSRPTSWSWRAA